jgi:hypothetical protein
MQLDHLKRREFITLLGGALQAPIMPHMSPHVIQL